MRLPSSGLVLPPLCRSFSSVVVWLFVWYAKIKLKFEIKIWRNLSSKVSMMRETVLIVRVETSVRKVSRFKRITSCLPGGVVPNRFSIVGEASCGNGLCIGVDRTGGCVARQYALNLNFFLLLTFVGGLNANPGVWSREGKVWKLYSGRWLSKTLQFEYCGHFKCSTNPIKFVVWSTANHQILPSTKLLATAQIFTKSSPLNIPLSDYTLPLTDSHREWHRTFREDIDSVFRPPPFELINFSLELFHVIWLIFAKPKTIALFELFELFWCVEWWRNLLYC